MEITWTVWLLHNAHFLCLLLICHHHHHLWVFLCLWINISTQSTPLVAAICSFPACESSAGKWNLHDLLEFTIKMSKKVNIVNFKLKCGCEKSDKSSYDIFKNQLQCFSVNEFINVTKAANRDNSMSDYSLTSPTNLFFSVRHHLFCHIVVLFFVWMYYRIQTATEKQNL